MRVQRGSSICAASQVRYFTLYHDGAPSPDVRQRTKRDERASHRTRIPLMSAVVEWTLDRPPNLDKDFPDDRANGERARDVWYERRRRPDDKTLPVVDLLASEEVQKQQRHERSMLWKKALRRYNNAQRDKNEEAERKRSARLLTNLSAGLGDAEAQSRLDAEADRGRRRRADAKERAQQLQNTIDTASALRAQQAVKAVAIQESVRWAVEQRERPRLP